MSSSMSTSTSTVPTKKPRRGKTGPITDYLTARRYLDNNKIPQLFESLLSSLMLEKPTDLSAHINQKLEEVKEKGIENVNWETFVHDLHPLRDPKRKELIYEEQSKLTKRPPKSPIVVVQSDLFTLTQPPENA